MNWTQASLQNRLEFLETSMGNPPTPGDLEEMCAEVCELAGIAKDKGWDEQRIYACQLLDQYCQSTPSHPCPHCELT